MLKIRKLGMECVNFYKHICVYNTQIDKML